MKIKNKKTFIVKVVFSLLIILAFLLDHKCVVPYIASLVIKSLILVLFLISITIAEKMEK